MAITISPVNMEERAKLGIKAGDTVRVWQKIEEKGKTRLQAFEGLVLARKHGDEAGGTFTVRRISSGVGIERIFPLYSPAVDKIEIIRRAKVRRAKLYYIREKVAREMRRQLRRMKLMGIATQSEAEQAAEAQRRADEAAAAEEAEVAENSASDDESAEEVAVEAGEEKEGETEQIEEKDDSGEKKG